MDQKLVSKKRNLLRGISEETYTGLRNYVADVYLANYDLKVLMARKFSNLFYSFLPLLKEENGGRVEYQYQKLLEKRKGDQGCESNKEPVVISNRALSLLKEDIKSGKFKRILLADDVILHGRTLNEVYSMIESWFEEGKVEGGTIHVCAYARSEDKMLQNLKFMKEPEPRIRHICHTNGECREISNTIVDFFYLTGVAYTSYVPNVRVDSRSFLGEKLREVISKQENQFFKQSGKKTEWNSIKAYVYIEKNLPDFAISCNMRIYEFEECEEFILIPMVMLKPIKKETLQNCLRELKTLMNDEFYDRMDGYFGSEIGYRTLVYLLSALWGWKFAQNVLGVSCDQFCYEQSEEELNFTQKVLKVNVGQEDFYEKLNDLWSKVAKTYEPAKNISSLVEKEKDYKEVLQLFKNNEECFTPEQLKNNTRVFVGRFLYLNGQLDEKHSQQVLETEDEKKDGKPAKRKRLMGFPVYQLVDWLSDLNHNVSQIINAILEAIDFGKGSIVPISLKEKDKEYFLSVIHAGEENYKYFFNEYFPFLYGLYHLEYLAGRRKTYKKLKTWKEAFTKEYKEYWKQNNHFYLEDDIGRLETMEVTEDYSNVILNAEWKWMTEDDVVYAIKLANDIAE